MMIDRVGHKKLRCNYLANIGNMDKKTLFQYSRGNTNTLLTIRRSL